MLSVRYRNTHVHCEEHLKKRLNIVLCDFYGNGCKNFFHELIFLVPKLPGKEKSSPIFFFSILYYFVLCISKWRDTVFLKLTRYRTKDTLTNELLQPQKKKDFLSPPRNVLFNQASRFLLHLNLGKIYRKRDNYHFSNKWDYAILASSTSLVPFLPWYIPMSLASFGRRVCDN